MRLPSRCAVVLVVLACVAVLGGARAEAQSAADLQAAAQAFQEGQRAQMRGEFAQAAEMFDLANHTAPSAAALRSAIRMHTSAGHHAAAATRAAHALATYPEDAPTVELANQVIAGCGTLTGHLQITCEPGCAITLAGRVVSTNTVRSDLYVDPGVHTIRASWGTHTIERQVTASAGSQETLNFMEADAHTSAAAVEPTVEPTNEPTTEPVTGPVTGPSTSDDGGSGLTPVVFAISAGLTVAVAGAAIGVGVDMLGARDRYVAMPTEAGYRDGVSRETITNALIGTSIGLAVTTVVLAILTDWDGDAATSTHGPGGTALLRHLHLAASPQGASAALSVPF